MAAPQLKTILTPSLFRHIVDCRMPFPKNEPLDYASVGRQIFLEDTFKIQVKDQAWPAMKALSELGGPENVPDLMGFLPEPSDPNFPIQTLGLQLLLDQCPRALLSMRGMDSRYRVSYFDVLSRRLAEQWSSLPDEKRPDTWTRWEREGIASFGWWMIARFWFGAPWIHSEMPNDQARAVGYTNETREAVERRTDTRDAYRDDPSIRTDTHAFGRMFAGGPPQGDGLTLEKFCYWFCMLMDIHKPIADKFGRYPSANWLKGRDNTPEEEEWLKEEGIPEVDPELRRQIREDVEAGKWTPLGDA